MLAEEPAAIPRRRPHPPERPAGAGAALPLRGPAAARAAWALARARRPPRRPVEAVPGRVAPPRPHSRRAAGVPRQPSSWRRGPTCCEAAVARRIPDHLGMYPQAPPLARARAPDDGPLNQLP